MKRSLLHSSLLFALISPMEQAVAATQPFGMPGVRSDGKQQVEPKKKEITTSVTRSIENETISMTALFPDDYGGIRVALFNLLGKLMDVDPTTAVAKGSHTFVFRTNGLPNGPYLVVLEAGGQRITKKIMLNR